MIIAKQCACGQNVEFEAEDLPLLTCPSCGRSLHEQFGPQQNGESPKVELPPSVRFPASAPMAQPARLSDADKELDLVRRQSCYKTLRGLIGTVIGIGCAILILSVAGIVATLLSFQAPAQVVAGSMGLIAICALAFVVLIAIKQALLLAIDMADVLIHDRADRRAAESNPELATVDK